MGKSYEKVKYGCKFCSFITSDKIAAYKHMRVHFKGISKIVLILHSDKYIEEIKQPSNNKKVCTTPIHDNYSIVVGQGNNNSTQPEGFQSQYTYKCSCGADCNYTAGKLKKLINHVLTNHHPDKTEEWVKSNFSSLFVKDKKKVPIKQKRLSYLGGNIQLNSGHQPLYTRCESGHVYQSRVNRDFDYDLDGRVK